MLEIILRKYCSASQILVTIALYLKSTGRLKTDEMFVLKEFLQFQFDILEQLQLNHMQFQNQKYRFHCPVLNKQIEEL